MKVYFEKIAPPRPLPGSAEPDQLGLPVKQEDSWLVARFNRLKLW
ncbi:hypothetical protein [Bradyrhizobium sp. 149]|nr:hypothetical protein [Bradyrhizobium sp. 149]